VEVLSTGTAGHSRGVLCNPRLVWEWYDWRRSLIDACLPMPRTTSSRGGAAARIHADHAERGRLARTRRHAQRHPLHGSIWDLKCCARCVPVRRVQDLTTPLSVLPPSCRTAGARSPGVVWFGESIQMTPRVPRTRPPPAMSSSRSNVQRRLSRRRAAARGARTRSVYGRECNLEPTTQQISSMR